jgi:adenosylmethionine-8-amino-7-oxononanoate aminotransferase
MDNLWLPYTAHKGANPPIEIIGADGCYLKTRDGKQFLDGISSWWVACHGYNHPHLVKAVQEQAAKLHHVMFAGFTHEPAQKLATRLAKLTGLPRVFFSDSGSTAVEVALKMAVQYWRNKNKNSKKQKFLHFTNSYHGDTMGAMSVSDDSVMHAAFAGHNPLQYMVDIPSDELGFEDFDKLLQGSANQLAGVIIEPLIQMAGGMKFHSADTLGEIYRLCKKHNVLFIADEIATGFGRTGYMFACEEAGITPDIICIGKALTGGMITLAATLASDEIFTGFEEHAFMHGPTYMANPIACAAANASLDLFESEPRLQQISQIEEQLTALLSPLATMPVVKDVRVKGALGVIQLNQKPDVPLLRQKFHELNLNIRPFGDVIYLAPSYIISHDELKILCSAIAKLLEELNK